MRLPQTLLVTSCKGGIGKSTVAVNLAAALTALGRRILLVDCDFGSRCLDLLLGCEDDLIYDICDVALGRVPPEKARLSVSVPNGTIDFVTAPAFYENELNTELFCQAVRKLADVCAPDLILLDTSGGMSSIEMCASVASGALIVTSHQPAAVRAAEKTGAKLAALGVTESRLIINCFDFQRAIRGERAGIAQMIDMAHLRVIGVVPYDYNLELAQEIPMLAVELKTGNCAAAFRNIARRLVGDTVPLFTGFRNIPIRKLRQT